MKPLNPPPSRVIEFNEIWRNWFRQVYGKLPNNQKLSFVTVTAAYTADKQTVILCNATSGAFTVTLPLAADAEGSAYYIKKIDASANAVTVDGNGAETIDGAATQSLATQYDVIKIICDGTSWHILSAS